MSKVHAEPAPPRRLPCEDLLYLGDTARLPYGTKSPETVRRYARRAVSLLLARGVKALVVACNTASALALDAQALPGRLYRLCPSPVELPGFSALDSIGLAKLLKGDWAHFFDVGRQYKAKTGKAWYDQSGFVWNAMVNQLPEGYYTKDGKLNVEGNADLKDRWSLLAGAAKDGLSAAQAQWDWNGGKSFVDGTFATFMCPGWMLGVVQSNAEGGGGDASTGWDFADVFPGGAANWGGSFLAVSETSKQKEAAAALADWLTQPDQQVKQFEAAGTFPSTVKAAKNLADNAKPNEFFNNAPVGAILAARAEGVQAQFKGPDDSLIQENVFGPAIQALDQGKADATSGWDQAIQLLKDLVVNG